jgi:multiple sugar transport system ATP-binding protein
VGARPETIRLSLEAKDGWHPMSVYVSEPQGPDTIVNLRLGEQFIRVVTEPDVRPGPGETVWVNVERGGLRLFDATTGQTL